MGFKDLLRKFIPTVEDENCFYLITRILDTSVKYKARRFTNVTPGLGSLLKRKYGGEYFAEQKVYYMMSKRDTFEDLECSMKNLETILVKEKKREM